MCIRDRYVFGAFLVYTGYKMFTATDDEEFDPQGSKIFLFIKKFLPLAPHDGNGKFVVKENGKSVYTCLLYTSPSPRDRTRSRMPSSA